MKIRVENFQSIEKQELEVEGFTVVTGPSNLGKSALVRAIAGAFLGEAGDFYVRKGEDYSRVQIQGNDFELGWTKVPTGKATPSRQTTLTVSGKKYSKIGRDHQDITKPLNVREIRVGPDGRLTPQIALQHDLPFLLGETPATVAEVLKVLGKVDVVTEAQGMARKDHRAASSKIAIREEDLKTLEEEIQIYDGIGPMRERFEKLKKQEWDAEVARRSNWIERVDRLLEPRKKLPAMPDPQIVKFAKTGEHLIQLDRVDQLERRKRLPARPGLPPMKGAVKLELVEQALIRQEELGKVWEKGLELKNRIEVLEREKAELEPRIGECPTCRRQF